MIVDTASVAMHPNVGVAAGTRVVVNGAGIRGIAGLNATVWIENRTGEVGVNDLDGAYEVRVDAQVCAICTCGGGLASEDAICTHKLISLKQLECSTGKA